MLNVKVELGDRSYPVFIGDGTFGKLGEMLTLYGFVHQLAVITDTTVQKLFGEQLAADLAPLTTGFEMIAFPPGEKSKSLATVEMILGQMLHRGFDRNAVVLAVGGGVVGDVAGFAASIYKRRVKYVQVPTTLLAQVDSSLGGKTGVNHALGKNMIGTFHQPSMVWCDLALLKSLPRKQVVCGLGEVVKYAAIRDEGLFTHIEENFDDLLSLDAALMPEIIKRCCEIKARIVAEDEREQGARVILNFGHTIGHALEAALGYGKISHGEAVLLGMLAESKMAVAAEVLREADFQRLQRLVARFALSKKISRLQPDKVLSLMKNDKKARGNTLRFVLPTSIGEVMVVENMEPGLIELAVSYILEH